MHAAMTVKYLWAFVFQRIFQFFQFHSIFTCTISGKLVLCHKKFAALKMNDVFFTIFRWRNIDHKSWINSLVVCFGNASILRSITKIGNGKFPRKTDLCCLSSFPIRRILENLQKESKITIQLVLIIAFSIELLFDYLHYFPASRLDAAFAEFILCFKCWR